MAKGNKRVKKIAKSLHITQTCKENRKIYTYMKLKTKYEKIVEQYLIAFVEKQELDIENCYWVADKIGEILSINEQYYLSFDDIRFDVDNNIKAGTILEWQQESIDNYSKKKKYKINYENYLKWKTK